MQANKSARYRPRCRWLGGGRKLSAAGPRCTPVQRSRRRDNDATDFHRWRQKYVIGPGSVSTANSRSWSTRNYDVPEITGYSIKGFGIIEFESFGLRTLIAGVTSDYTSASCDLRCVLRAESYLFACDSPRVMPRVIAIIHRQTGPERSSSFFDGVNEIIEQLVCLSALCERVCSVGQLMPVSTRCPATRWTTLDIGRRFDGKWTV